jgi:hypothetical protein
VRKTFGSQATGVLGGALLLLTAGCGEQLPTFPFQREIPVDANSFEVRIPLAEFASNIRILGGFGLAADLRSATVANGFGDGDPLTAHALIRVDTLPSEIITADSLGDVGVDRDFTIPGGRLVVRLDTIGARPTSNITLSADALGESWDFFTATWTMAADSVTRADPWTQPGGGAVTPLGSGAWDTEAEGSDSLVIELDSAGVALIQDMEAPAAGGVRIRLEDAGERVRIRSVSLVGNARPSFKPDTLVDFSANVPETTFIFDQGPQANPGEWIIGGVPAFRTLMDINIPTELPGDPELCALVECPITLTPELLLFASVVLTGADVQTQFFPLDTLLIDARGVVDPDALPRSPLGEPVIPTSALAGPELFRPETEDRTLQIPVTFYVQDLIRGETPGGDPVFPTLALLTPFEPFSFEVMRFQGAGTEGEPYLRLLLTVGGEVGLP